MTVTQKQIAERLSISPSLVARALMGHKEVAEDTRLRVAAAAREMGYGAGSNREARALAARRFGHTLKSGVAAVVFCPAPGVSFSSLPYSEPIWEGLESEAASLGLDVCFCPARADEIPRLVRDRSVDGVIVFGYYPEYVTEIRGLGLPVVTFHSRYENAHSIASDDRRGGWLATRHLLELGHRRIAFLGTQYVSGQPVESRLAGYRDAMAEYGIEVPEPWICTSLIGAMATPTAPCVGCGVCAACVGWDTLAAQNKGGRESGELPFTAVVCYNDPIAMASIAQLSKRGFKVPRDISFTGFDDTSIYYPFEPSLTSVDYMRGEMGRDAMRLLHSAIHTENDSGDYQHHVVPTSLSIRQSTGPAPEEKIPTISQSLRNGGAHSEVVLTVAR